MMKQILDENDGRNILAKIPTKLSELENDLPYPVKYVESLNTDTLISLRNLDSGTYVLYGKFKPYDGSTHVFTFSTGMLVSIVKTTSASYVQVFYSKNNTIQYLAIKDDEYTRKDAKLVDMESIANLVTIINENSDDAHYPSAKAVYDLYNMLSEQIGVVNQLVDEINGEVV